MQAWVIVFLVLFVYVVTLRAFESVVGISKLRKELQEFNRKLRENPSSIDDAEMEQHVRKINKVMLFPMLFSLIVFLPLYYALSSRYGTVIDTPLGRMGLIWWMMVSSLLANIVVGGVTKWLARYSED